MPLFEFTLVGSGSGEHIDDIANRLYETGCDDAAVSRSRGRVLVDFARNAPTLDAAIGSAIEQANLAGIVTDRIEPDPLVSLGEIAERSGLTRQWHAVVLDRQPPAYLRRFIDMLATGPSVLGAGLEVSA